VAQGEGPELKPQYHKKKKRAEIAKLEEENALSTGGAILIPTETQRRGTAP
jgi:hypothetical protein